MRLLDNMIDALRFPLPAQAEQAHGTRRKVSEDFYLDDFKDVYLQAYALGLKGCTTFRPNTVTGAILSEVCGAGGNSQGCPLEREPD